MVEHSPAGRRALIVEDETVFAMGLAVDMQALGFANCDLAANGQDAFLKAMEDQPRAGSDSSCHPMLSITCQCSITNGEVLRPLVLSSIAFAHRVTLDRRPHTGSKRTA